MARNKDSEEDDVSLFPFLSILSCVIGVLTLLITAMAISQMDTPEIVEAENFDELQKSDLELKQQVQDLQERTKNSNKSVVEMLQAQDRLTILLDQLKEKEKQVDQSKKKIDPNFVQVDIDTKIKELELEKVKLDEQLSELQEELGQRKDRKEGIVQVRPGGSGVNFEPTFVECRKEGIVLYSNDGSSHNVLTSQIGSDVRFLSELDQISEAPERVMTFLLRDDGIDTYYRARGVARSRYAKNGKLPVLGKGKLDLSLFMRKAE